MLTCPVPRTFLLQAAGIPGGVVRNAGALLCEPAVGIGVFAIGRTLFADAGRLVLLSVWVSFSSATETRRTGQEVTVPVRSGKPLGTLITVVMVPTIMVVSDQPDSVTDWASELPAKTNTGTVAL